MPKSQSKKTTHKKTAHIKKKTVPTSVQRDITNAVNSLPSLLIDQNTIESIQSKQTGGTPPSKPSIIPATYQPPQHSGTLLILGVALLMTAILGLWVWNMKAMVSNVFAAPSAEKKIIDSVGNDFSDIIDHLEKQDTLSTKLNELQAQAILVNNIDTTSTTSTQTTNIKAVFSTILHSTTTTSTP